MKVILSRGGNYRGERFDASETPQDVPDTFGRALIRRGLATEVKKPPAKKKMAAKAAVKDGE